MELTPGLVVCPLRVHVPNKHILAQKLYQNYYYPKPKYLIIWVPGSSWVMVPALNHRLRCSVLSLLGGSGNLVSILITPLSHIRPIPIISLLSPLAGLKSETRDYCLGMAMLGSALKGRLGFRV